MKSPLLLVALFTGLLWQTGEVAASQYQVSPVQVVFTGGESTALLAIQNQAPDALRFQVTVNEWSQAPDGEMLLEPTEDIQMFPRLLTVPAGGEANVRVSRRVPAGEREKTYRIFIEELPPLESADTGGGATLRVLTKTGIPIFITPEQPSAKGSIDSVAVQDGILRFTLRNGGNSHFSVRAVSIRALNADRQELAAHTLSGWYVLAGQLRDYRLTLPPDVCGGLRWIEIQADTTAGPVAATQEILCTTASPVKE